MSLVAFFPHPTFLLWPTCLGNLQKISTVLVYLALLVYLAHESTPAKNDLLGMIHLKVKALEYKVGPIGLLFT